MSGTPSTSTCSTCGTALPPRARFCPECGGRAGETPAPAPAVQGMLPLAGVAVVVVALAIVLFAVGAWIAGLVVVAVALAAAALAARSAERARPAGVFRARGRAVLETVAAQAQAQRELVPLRIELQRLQSGRAAHLQRLGEAVYAEDEPGTEAARAALRELDDRIAAKEAEMTQVAESTNERVGRARLEAQSTQLLEPPPPGPPEPTPPPVREPYPPPDEGTPPAPEPVPEPYPPPDEGDPPRQP